MEDDELISRISMLEHRMMMIEFKPNDEQFAGGQMAAVPMTQLGTSNDPKNFDIVDGKVVNCKIYCGNKYCTCRDYAIDNTLGDIWLHVVRGSTEYTISVDQSFVAESSSSISIKLWEYDNGYPTLDVRPGFIPVFAL